MLRYFLIGFAAVFGFVLIVAVDAFIKLYLVNGKPLASPDKKFITAVPFNLEQVAGISKFRSCQGHDFSGKGPEGVIEGGRSMKHYIVPKSEIRDQLNTIEVYSPMDGRLAFVLPEGKGDQLMISPNGESKWAAVIFHVDRLPGIGSGTQLRAGQLIGYANVKNRHDFDLAMVYTDGTLIAEIVARIVHGGPILPLPKADYLVSAFEYMTPEVIKKFEDAGFDVDNMQFRREFRDSNKCNFDQPSMDSMKDEWQYLPGESPYENIPMPEENIPQPQMEQNFQNPPKQLYPSP